MDRRTLDELVTKITRELAGTEDDAAVARTASAAGAAAGGGVGSFCLIDNWRVREEHREAFLDYYARHVADVVKQMPGYRDGRVLSSLSPDYSWHVQALYEFESDAVLDRFTSDFNRLVKQVNRQLDMDAVLDAMADWVLAHEDGTLHEVWR